LPAPTAPPALSLHDALPICADEMKVLEVVRDEIPLMGPGQDFELREGDVILLEGSARAIHGLIERRGVEAGTALADDHRVRISRSEEHTSELQSRENLVCRL